MKKYSTASVLISLALCWLACQPEKKSTTTQAPAIPELILATLTKPTYAVGDVVSLHLTQPLKNVTILWDGTAAVTPQPVADSVRINTRTKTVGIHQLIVRGVTATAQPVADTLAVELRSDIVPQELPFTVLSTYPHQTTSFTQGLEFSQGTLYESTGLNGQSRLMNVNLATGVASQTVALSNQYFGEGITVVNNKIYELTWTSGVCFRYNLDFTLDKLFPYHTQGWGLTHRDSTLILSDGSNRLFFYTPDFQPKGELAVYDNQGPVMNLNELEYVDGSVFANVWQTNRIVQIDLKTGKVVAVLNLQSVADRTGINTQENVLNGIAYQPQEKAFYVTGKNWPTLFKLKVKTTGIAL